MPEQFFHTYYNANSLLIIVHVIQASITPLVSVMTDTGGRLFLNLTFSSVCCWESALNHDML